MLLRTEYKINDIVHRLFTVHLTQHGWKKRLTNGIVKGNAADHKQEVKRAQVFSNDIDDCERVAEDQQNARKWKAAATNKAVSLPALNTDCCIK